MEIPEVIKQAYEIVKPLGEKYEPGEVYYIIDEECHEPEEHQALDYCADCAKKIIKDRPLRAVAESSPEDENFCQCEECGKILSASIIWTEQEMEHWLEHTKPENLKDEQACYELMNILDWEGYGAYEKFPVEVEQIAQKVILHHQQLT